MTELRMIKIIKRNKQNLNEFVCIRNSSLMFMTKKKKKSGSCSECTILNEAPRRIFT